MTAMTPGEASKQLGIQPSTLRKYCLLLEQNGVEFARNAKNSRQYSDMNIVTLQRMITLIQAGDVSVEDAAYAASRWSKGEDDETAHDSDTGNAPERYSDDIAAAMVKEIHSLKQEIEEQRKVIDAFRTSQEERDKYFVRILEDLQGEIVRLNEQQALPEPEPEEEDSPEMDQPSIPEKKGFLSRLFRKKGD